MQGLNVHVTRQLKLTESVPRPVLASELGLSQAGMPAFWLLVASDDGQLVTVEAKTCRLCIGDGCTVEGCAGPEAPFAARFRVDAVA